MPQRVRLMRDLEVALERLRDFESPVESLEQYRTPGDVAALMIWEAYMRSDLARSVVVDLGCGTGVLAHGSLLLGAPSALCLDVDWSALTVARDNLSEFRGSFDLVAGDARSLPLRPAGDYCSVVMNPPFGVKRRGADVEFLRSAAALCSTVYSVHKLSPGGLRLIARLAEELGCRLDVIAEATMSLRQTLRHHRRRVYRFKVVLIRLARTSSGEGAEG